jgi:diguanylate cyclase (GGDEF)-like protein
MDRTLPLDLDDLPFSGRLPSLPAVALEVLRVCQDPEASVDELVRVLGRDPALAAKLLQTANSSFYNRGHEVTSLHRAAMMLGLRALKVLALGFTLVHELPQREAAAGLDLKVFWHRCAVNAVIARTLALTVGSRWCEEAFLAGLVAPIGKLALAQGMPDRYAEAVHAGDGWPPETTERDHIGFTSSELAEALLRSWGVPELIVVAASYSERLDALERVTADHRELAELVGLALEASAMFFSDDRGTRLAAFGEKAERLYGLRRNDIDALVETLSAEIGDTAEVLALDLPPGFSYEALIDEARMQIASMSLEAVMSLEQTTREADELARENAALAARAMTDPLTELPNRAALDDFVTRHVQQRMRGPLPDALGILMIDVDRFKAVNDTYGHQLGDDLLRAVAGAMLGVTRANELLARYGGEEFCLVMPQTTVEGLRIAGERLREAVAARSMALGDGDAGTIRATVSVGGCCLERIDSEDSWEQLVELADQALYRAKAAGRNRVEIAVATPAGA